MVTTNFNPVNDIIIGIAFIGGIIVYVRTRIPAQAFKNLQSVVASYEEKIKAQDITIEELRVGRIENTNHISRLEGQIELYKELPLRELADGIKEISGSNQLILKELQKSSIIAAEDRDVLVKGAKS